MYVTILKKDLKRKKTMNIIILLFVIISTMFVSSSVNNISTVSSALDHYFDLGRVPDFFVVTKTYGKEDKNVLTVLEEEPAIQSYGVEPIFYAAPTQYNLGGKKLKTGQNVIFSSFEQSSAVFYDENNRKIESVCQGEVYLHTKEVIKNELKIGDVIHLQVGETSCDLKLAGSCKDAVLGSDMMGMSRFLMSQEDYDRLMKDPEADLAKGSLLYIKTNDVEEVEQQFTKINSNIIFMASRDVISTTYIMDIVTAYALLMISICLILIAFLALRFTITFTLSEEFREIGVMKAIGIQNPKIRGLYLVKYFAISIVGTVIGLVVGIPFSNFLIDSVSQNIVMEHTSGYWINLLCGILVVFIIMLFSYRCTRKVNQLSPIDAIRNGDNGERYRKKGFLRLSKSRIRPVIFMSINDIFSSLKRYMILMITFIIGLTVILLIVNTFNTLTSNELMSSFSFLPSDLYVENEPEIVKQLTTDGKENMQKRMTEIEHELASHSIPARCHVEIELKLTIIHDEYVAKSLAFQAIGVTTKQYSYLEGTAPVHENEIAITKRIADKLHAGIGDYVNISIGDEDREFLITALYESMINMGEGLRFNEDADISYEQNMGSFVYQITFENDPDSELFDQQVKTVKKLFKHQKVYVKEQYLDSLMGGIQTMVDGVRYIALCVLIIVCVLIAVLMERSLIAKEKSEIAIVKAIGFKNSTVIAWHTLRHVITLLFSTVVAILLSRPVTKLTTGQVFKMLGAGEAVHFEINPLEVCVIYPIITLSATIFAIFLTALLTRKITAADSSNIE